MFKCSPDCLFLIINRSREQINFSYTIDNTWDSASIKTTYYYKVLLNLLPIKHVKV